MMFRSVLAVGLSCLLAVSCFGESGREGALAVSAVLPADAATGVDVDAAIVVTFSKAVKAETATPASFVVTQGAAAITGVVTAAGTSVLFAPLRPLAPNTEYTARITATLTDADEKGLAMDHVWSFTTGPVPDRTAPAITRLIPEPDAEEVSPRVVLRVGFSESMKTTTIKPDTVILRAGSTRVDGALMFDGSTVTLTPFAALAPNTLYTATVSPGPEDLAGNGLSSGVTWSFRTVLVVDQAAPTVTGTTPPNAATEVPVDASVRITFSEPMAPLTLNGASITLSDDMNLVAGSVSASGNTAVFTPSAPLRPTTRYTVAVEVGAMDLAGNPLAARSTATFTTAPGASMDALAVNATNPVQNATGIAADTTVSATFSRPVLPASVNAASFTLARGETIIGATVTVAGTLAILTPTRPLEPSTVYTARLSTSVQDANGVALPAPRSWTFTTGPAQDRTPPVVSQVAPADDAVEIPLTPSVTATFTEPLDAATVNAQTFIVSARGVAVSGQVSLASNVVRFVPTAALAPSTTYTATLSIAVKDVAGNALTAPYVWRFTTQGTPDFTPPAVTGSAPGPGATNIPITTAIIVNFSEPIDPLTVTPVSFTLAKDNNPVAATVYGAGRTAILAPTAPLENGATYIVTVWTLITDVAGNPLPQNQNWFFTTAPRPDTTAPWIVATTPSPGRQDVAPTSTVSAVFSEAIDASSVTPVTFTLASPNAQIAGIVSVNGTAAAFTPNAALVPATRYTATLFGSIRDVAGNALNTSYTWSFVTSATP